MDRIKTSVPHGRTDASYSDTFFLSLDNLVTQYRINATATLKAMYTHKIYIRLLDVAVLAVAGGV